jgi:hypothetical protein
MWSGKRPAINPIMRNRSCPVPEGQRKAARRFIAGSRHKSPTSRRDAWKYGCEITRESAMRGKQHGYTIPPNAARLYFVPNPEIRLQRSTAFQSIFGV